MIAIRGYDSAISRELLKLLPSHEVALDVERGQEPPLHAERYLFAQGLLRPKLFEEQTADEISEGWDVNFIQVSLACDRIIAGNDHARICVVGSESAFSGSFDRVYAESKAFLHHYVENKALRTEHQQLFCIAPTIIRDAGMTLRRRDLAEVELRAAKHPKRRWLTAAEVARFAFYCLYVDRGYISGVVFRMNGGAHATSTGYGKEHWPA